MNEKARRDQLAGQYMINEQKNKHAQALGRKGGKVKSEAKSKAVRENGKLGGRPSADLYRSQLKEQARIKQALEFCIDPKFQPKEGLGKTLHEVKECVNRRII